MEKSSKLNKSLNNTNKSIKKKKIKNDLDIDNEKYMNSTMELKDKLKDMSNKYKIFKERSHSKENLSK